MCKVIDTLTPCHVKNPTLLVSHFVNCPAKTWNKLFIPYFGQESGPKMAKFHVWRTNQASGFDRTVYTGVSIENFPHNYKISLWRIFCRQKTKFWNFFKIYLKTRCYSILFINYNLKEDFSTTFIFIYIFNSKHSMAFQKLKLFFNFLKNCRKCSFVPIIQMLQI